MVTQVLEGEGVGWLKLNRLRKLMEDESYRNFALSKLNKTLERKIGPDDHIDDVVIYNLMLACFHVLIFVVAVCSKTSLERNAESASGSNAWP